MLCHQGLNPWVSPDLTPPGSRFSFRAGVELEASCVITGGLVPRDCSWIVAGRVPGCLPGLVKGPAPASSLGALAADDEGVISEPLERFGFVSFSFFTWAITYAWNILPLLPFTCQTPVHLLCLSLNVTPLEISLVPLFLLSASFAFFFFYSAFIMLLIILLFVCVCMFCNILVP